MQHKLLETYSPNKKSDPLAGLVPAGYVLCKIALRNDLNPHDIVDAVMRVCFDVPELRALADRWTAYDGDTKRVAMPQIV